MSFRKWRWWVATAVVMALLVAVAAWVGAADQRMRALTVLVEYVTEAPVIDGDGSDPAWRQAVGLFNETSSLQAVYTDEEIAFLFKMTAPSATTRTPGDWVYQDGRWIRWAEQRAGEPWATVRTQPYVAMFWEIDPFGLSQGTCTTACHEGARGAAVPKGKADYWALMSRHGSGKGAMAETGWLLGALGVSQCGTLSYAGDPVDPAQISAGQVTYRGYAEDRYVVSAAAAQNGQTFLPDDDGMLFRVNGTDAPEYIKPEPVNYVDATVITQADIDAGRAVKLSQLSPEQVARAWAAYERLHAAVPQLILLDAPQGSGIEVAASWKDGVWTLEYKRALVTGDPNDIQFSDLGALYVATLHAVRYFAPDQRNATAFGFTTPLTVRFAPPPKKR